jgi:hypothetical protein
MFYSQLNLQLTNALKSTISCCLSLSVGAKNKTPQSSVNWGKAASRWDFMLLCNIYSSPVSENKTSNFNHFSCYGEAQTFWHPNFQHWQQIEWLTSGFFSLRLVYDIIIGSNVSVAVTISIQQLRQTQAKILSSSGMVMRWTDQSWQHSEIFGTWMHYEISRQLK